MAGFRIRRMSRDADWPGGKEGWIPTVPEAVSDEAPEGFKGVPWADLLSLGAGTSAIADRNFNDPGAEPSEFGGDFRAEAEAVFAEIHLTDEMQGDELETGGFIGELLAVKQVGDGAEETVAETMPGDELPAAGIGLEETGTVHGDLWTGGEGGMA
jgi:hypothetical protein